MINIDTIKNIGNSRKIAILDTSSISFMQRLDENRIIPDKILSDYDLILIPYWVLTEIEDAPGRAGYVENLIRKGYPIHAIDELAYSDLASNEEGNLYQIVQASAKNIGAIKSYLRRYIQKDDVLDMDSYSGWIKKLYDEWPIEGETLSSGRSKKKNAGEISITILAEVLSWYYPDSETITIYSQDRDTFNFPKAAEEALIRIFADRSPVPVSYKSNDALLCQLYRDNLITSDGVRKIRKDCRKITYSKEQSDKSVVLVTEQVDTEEFIELIKESTVHIIF